jgi:DNA-binding transcriptional regulator YdaS (Cro superfamily)
MKEQPKDQALILAIQAAGGTAKLARKLGIKSQAISQWRRCPPKRAMDVAKASGIPLHVLRPDLYPNGMAA